MDARGESPTPSPRMLCLGCDYPLDHLDQHRCPECGREFDPADPTSFDEKHREHPIPWRIALPATAGALYLPATVRCLAGWLEFKWALVTPGWPGGILFRDNWLAMAITSALICYAVAAFARLGNAAVFILAIVVSLIYGSYSTFVDLLLWGWGLGL